jgi:hypothetical protein
MNLVEISYPQGSLAEPQRQAIATDVVANLLTEPDAPAVALERAGHITHVWFHEALNWTNSAGAAPLVATVTVPEAWRAELSRHAIGAVRAAVARHAPHIGLGGPAVWINVVGVPDGGIGMGGKPAAGTDIVRYLTQDVTPQDAAGLPDGVFVDPVCGMRVHGTGEHAVTLQHDGATVAFCATGCRDVYAQDHHIG